MPDAVMRNRMERMGRHGQATLIVDQRDRALGAEPRRHPLLDPQREHVAIEGADLFADHDVDPELRMSASELPGLQRPSDLVVIGDEHVDPAGSRSDDHSRRLGAVTPGGMDVKIRPPGRHGPVASGQDAP